MVERNHAGLARDRACTAMRSARPKALKTVSHWWWALWPLRLSMCRLTPAWLTKPWKNSKTSWVSSAPIMPAVKGTSNVQPGAAGEIDHHAGQRLVERHVGVAVAGQALLVADRLGKGLAQGDAHVLDGVVAVDVQVALGLDLEVDSAVAGDLVEHVVEEADAGVELTLPLPSRSISTRILVSRVLRDDFGLPHCRMVVPG